MSEIKKQYGEPLRPERVAEPTRAQSAAAARQIFAQVRALCDSVEQARPPV